MGIKQTRVLNSEEGVREFFSKSELSLQERNELLGSLAALNSSKLAETLNKHILSLYGRYISEDGTAVNYSAMKTSK